MASQRLLLRSRRFRRQPWRYQEISNANSASSALPPSSFLRVILPPPAACRPRRGRRSSAPVGRLSSQPPPPSAGPRDVPWRPHQHDRCAQCCPCRRGSGSGSKRWIHESHRQQLHARCPRLLDALREQPLEDPCRLRHRHGDTCISQSARMRSKQWRRTRRRRRGERCRPAAGHRAREGDVDGEEVQQCWQNASTPHSSSQQQHHQRQRQHQ